MRSDTSDVPMQAADASAISRDRSAGVTCLTSFVASCDGCFDRELRSTVSPSTRACQSAATARGERQQEPDRVLLTAKLLTRVRPGVYRLNGAPQSWTQALLAGVLDAGEGAVASHSSAARLWNFPFWPERGFEITVPRARRPEVEGVLIHTSSVLGSADVTTRACVPCTTFERTLCDATTALSQIQLGRVLDDGLRRRVTTIERLRSAVLRLDSGPHRRLSLVQALIEQRGLGYVAGGSKAELRVSDVIRRAGLEPPVQQLSRSRQRTYLLP